MKSEFFDADGRQWRIPALTVGDLKKVRQTLSIDLADMGAEWFEQLGDPCVLVDVLHCLLEEEAKLRSLDAVGFARAMRGDTLDDATKALMETLIDFFPSRRKPALQKMIDKGEALAKMAGSRLEAILDSDRMELTMAAEFDRIEREMDAATSTSGKSSTNGLVSSDSTPAF